MISDKDARCAAAENKAKSKKRTDDVVSKVLGGFDLGNNAEDRRMLFEVTGMRISRDEFLEVDSSDDLESDEGHDELLPSDFVMMDRFIDEEDCDAAAQTYALNP